MPSIDSTTISPVSNSSRTFELRYRLRCNLRWTGMSNSSPTRIGVSGQSVVVQPHVGIASANCRVWSVVLMRWNVCSRTALGRSMGTMPKSNDFSPRRGDVNIVRSSSMKPTMSRATTETNTMCIVRLLMAVSSYLNPLSLSCLF